MLHPKLGWITIGDYYALQKAHALEPFLLEFVRWGYAFNVAAYTFTPSGADVPIPIGPALLYAAIVDLRDSVLGGQPPERTLKALFKLIGPWGALLQVLESVEGVLGVLGLAGSLGPLFDVIGRTLFPGLGPPPR